MLSSQRHLAVWYKCLPSISGATLGSWMPHSFLPHCLLFCFSYSGQSSFSGDSCLSFQSAGITDVRHHAWILSFLSWFGVGMKWMMQGLLNAKHMLWHWAAPQPLPWQTSYVWDDLEPLSITVASRAQLGFKPMIHVCCRRSAMERWFLGQLWV